jgi:hypothetical protein
MSIVFWLLLITIVGGLSGALAGGLAALYIHGRTRR